MHNEEKVKKTQMALRLCKDQTNAKHRRLNKAKRLEFYRLLKEVNKTQNSHKLDIIADKIQLLLKLDDNPLNHAWKRTHIGFYGYKHCIAATWGQWLDLVR